MYIGLNVEGKLADALLEREKDGFTRAQVCKHALWNYLKLDERRKL